MALQLQKPSYSSRREHIVDALRTAIIAGDLKPGQRITEVELANQLETSRAPVREALRQLETEGFVETSPYRETRISTVTMAELKEVLVPIRTLVETFALKQLMQNHNKEVLDTLFDIVGKMKHAAAALDRLAVIEHDLEFHRVLVQSLELSHPIRVWSSITPVIYRTFYSGTTLKTLGETVEGHTQLLKVIQGNDWNKAEQFLRTHIEEMELKFVDESEKKESIDE